MAKPRVNRALLGIWLVIMVFALFNGGAVELVLVGAIWGGMLWVVSRIIASRAPESRG